MHEQVDKIQKEIDELVRLCAENGAEALQEALGEDKFAKLGFLLLKMQEDDLEDRQFEALQRWLRSDEEALRFYIDFQTLSAMLYSHFDAERPKALLEQIKDALSARNI